jgi:AbrB family looped-hinge helix DNA binding protein
MKVAESRITAQGQVSVPAEIRRRLGVSAGATLEWDVRGDEVVVRRSARHSSEDVHRALFRACPEARTLEELGAGVDLYIRGRHARR